MTPQELKASILAMAFQGKLTTQDPFDLDIEKTINACKEDKKCAVLEGKFRNEKFRGAIVEHEYDIPDAWRVLYISDMALFQEGPGILAVDFRTTGIPLIRISGMQTNRVNLDGCNFLDPAMVENKWNHFKLDLGDILISTSASMDKVCEVFEDCVGAIPYTGQIRFKMYGGISKDYFKWFVQSPFYIKQIVDQQAGAAIKHYGPTHLKKMTIPIAPIEEQKRIVAKIEELLPLIDRYEQAWSKVEDFNKRFPEDIQKSILQMAIQGKLVEQRPEEGTGEELFLQIQAEKQRLIKEGVIKKENPLPEITDDEIPFDISDTWKWVRFGELVNECFQGINTAADHVVFEREQGVPIIQTGDVTSGKLNIIGTKLMSEVDYSKYCEKYQPRYNDIFYCNIGTIGKPYIFTENYKMLFHWNLFIIRYNHSCVLPMYLKTYLEYCTDYFKRNTDGTAMQFVSKKKLVNILVPLPPLAEQKRIVAKLEEILPLCERLK